MSKVTKAQIEEWKKKHGTIYELEANGKLAYVKDPTSDLRIMKSFVSARDEDPIKGVDVILNNSWLGGDEEIKSEEHKMGLLDQLDRLIDIPDYDIAFVEDHYVVTIEGMTCKLKPAERGDLVYADARNRTNKPFETNIHLLERIAVEGLDEIKKDSRKYLALILAAKEAKKQKYVSVKKL
jgi:hypothetical protein